MKRIQLVHGDCISVMQKIPDNSIDCVVTDPPYNFNFMGHAWDRFNSPQEFMKFSRKWATEALRILKPGGHLISFCSTKMYHWMAVGIELAGFIVKDMISWLHSSGMPKSYDIAQAIEKTLTTGVARRKDRNLGVGRRYMFSQSLSNEVKDTGGKIPLTQPGSKQWEDYGTGLKPMQEPTILAQKPLSEKNYALNVLKHGVGGLNIGDTRVPLLEKDKVNLRIVNRNSNDTNKLNNYKWGFSKNEKVSLLNPKGKFTGNVIHDGSALVLDHLNKNVNDAASYFYCSKPRKKEKTVNSAIKNFHDTVKPVTLMEYLITLICPPNGLVLDPFMGSGTTAIACINKKFRFIGIEKEKKYANLAQNRVVAHVKMLKQV